MADKKISQLPASTIPLDGTEVLPIVQSSTTKQVSVANLTDGRAVSAASLTLTSSPLPIASGGTNQTAFTSPASSIAGLVWFDGTSFRNDTTTSHVGYNPSTNAFYANTPTLAGNTTLSTGNLVIGTSGKGIDFSATPQPAGMTSELLADYEEGTWTPAFSASGLSGITYGAATAGRYTKVGNQVTVWFYIYTTGTFTKGSNPLSITGLPYTAANVAGISPTCSIWNATRFDATPPVVGSVSSNSTSIVLYSSFNATGAGTDPVSVSSANMRSAAAENCNFVAGVATYSV